MRYSRSELPATGTRVKASAFFGKVSQTATFGGAKTHLYHKGGHPSIALAVVHCLECRILANRGSS